MATVMAAWEILGILEIIHRSTDEAQQRLSITSNHIEGRFVEDI